MSQTDVTPAAAGANRATPALDSITVHFATNRNRVKTDEYFGSDFMDSDGHYVMGTIEVDRITLAIVPGSLKIQGPPANASGSPLAVSDVLTQTNRNLTNAFVDALVDHQSANRRTADAAGLLFIHGYNTTFVASMIDAADLVSKYNLSEVFCFSWPSAGKLLDYKSDQRNAELSAGAVGLWFANMLAQLKAKKPLLHLICHSMGNHVLSGAIQTIRASAPTLLADQYFEHAILAAADEEWDAFSKVQVLQKLPPLSNWVEIYTNANDGVLAFSQLVNGIARLGAFGPDKLFPGMPKQTIWIDCTAVGALGDDQSGLAGHSYFRLSPPVVADIEAVLLGAPQTKIPGRHPDPDPAIMTRKFYIPRPGPADV